MPTVLLLFCAVLSIISYDVMTRLNYTVYIFLNLSTETDELAPDFDRFWTSMLPILRKLFNAKGQTSLAIWRSNVTSANFDRRTRFLNYPSKLKHEKLRHRIQ